MHSESADNKSWVALFHVGLGRGPVFHPWTFFPVIIFLYNYSMPIPQGATQYCFTLNSMCLT